MLVFNKSLHFKLGNFTVLTIRVFANWSQSKVKKTLEGIEIFLVDSLIDVVIYHDSRSP